MRRRTREWIVIISIITLLLLLCVFLMERQDRGILPRQTTSPEFSQRDRVYMQEHDTIRIYVDEELRYLLGGGEGGYLQDYMEQVLRPAGIRAEFLTDPHAKADGVLRVITPTLRAELQGKSYTSPLFQMEGALFVRNDSRTSVETAAGPVRTMLLGDRIPGRRVRTMTYQNRPLSCTYVDSPEEAVQRARRENAEAIIGDRSSIRAMLQRNGDVGAYQPLENNLYTCNVCIVVDSGGSAVYNILNECIYTSDRHNISYAMSEEWLDGEGPVFLRQDYRRSYLPVLIMLLSVLIAFFVYYIFNRSMYQELNDRMDKITESRNEMQTTFHGVGHYMAELTATGMITDINQAFADGITAAALHRPIWEVLDLEPEARQEIRSMVECGAAGGQAPRYETKIGQRDFVIDIFPVEDARGAVAQQIFMAIDVTQERMTKRQMLQDNKMIAIGQLAAGVAHEIRNPLGIIRNYCYVLKTMEDESIRAKAIEEIEHAVETSGAIIRNLLDFSRVSPGRMEEIDVEEHVRSILTLNEAAFREKNIELIVECEAPIRTYMAMEPFDMILMNLVKNAADAIEDRGRIIITVQAEGTDRFSLCVEDNGVGIDENALEEIFNPFYTTKGNMGTGLGLYIVYSEVEKLGGEIDVSSRKGEWTRFRVELPVMRDPGGGSDPAGEPGNAASEGSAKAASEEPAMGAPDGPGN